VGRLLHIGDLDGMACVANPLTLNQRVQGSSPCAPTIQLIEIHRVFVLTVPDTANDHSKGSKEVPKLRCKLVIGDRIRAA
jgi:hypothetical protein